MINFPQKSFGTKILTFFGEKTSVGVVPCFPYITGCNWPDLSKHQEVETVAADFFSSCHRHNSQHQKIDEALGRHRDSSHSVGCCDQTVSSDAGRRPIYIDPLIKNLIKLRRVCARQSFCQNSISLLLLFWSAAFTEWIGL
jgi:hypothetical protein